MLSRTLTGILLAAFGWLAPSGCDRPGASATLPAGASPAVPDGAAAASGGTSVPRASGFATPRELLDHLGTLDTAAGRFAMLDLVHARSKAETATVELTRQIDTARTDFVDAMREVYGEDSLRGDVTTLGMRTLSASLRTADLVDAPPRRAIARCTGPAGENHIVVLIRAEGRWWVAPETFLDGEPITDLSYFPFQSRFHGLRDFYAALASDVRAGAFLCVDDVWAAHLDGERRAWRNVGGMNIGNIFTRRRERPPEPPREPAP
jgi:hypothetical protein